MAIYLDHAATSPMRPEVVAAYTAALPLVGNPSSIHGQGQAAQELLEQGRDRVAASLGADGVEVVLTAGGTESVNLGIKGLFWARAPRRRILVPLAEHHATIDSVEWLAAREGAVLDWIEVDELGRIRLDALEAALAVGGDDVALVTALWANNEVGTIQPVAEIVAAAARYGVPVHLDAIAAYGQLPIDFHAVGAAALSVSAHKIGGPVGVGALLLARSASIEPLVHGGNQQRARSGTQDAAGASAFGVAAELATACLVEHAAHLAELRDRLVDGIRASVDGAVLRGDPDPAGRLPGNAHFTFAGCEGDSLLFLLDVAGFSVSTGSACQAGVPEASHVLLAMGVSEADARGALRFTLGPETTAAEVDALLAVLPGVVEQARGAGLAGRSPTLGRQ
ncbi:cysteine desulfurase family protein [Lysinimonas soli]|uniref:Cysteine desulfurase family protein n=1 Tax=Lysinimonas soli TaxID=1074233 RepID=A0ABW0NU63_9MICO